MKWLKRLGKWYDWQVNRPKVVLVTNQGDHVLELQRDDNSTLYVDFEGEHVYLLKEGGCRSDSKCVRGWFRHNPEDWRGDEFDV